MHGGGSAGTAAAQHAGRLGWALGLTATYMVAEVVGGLVTGSLALLADAAHMLTDVGGLALALMAIPLAAPAAARARVLDVVSLSVAFPFHRAPLAFQVLGSVTPFWPWYFPPRSL